MQRNDDHLEMCFERPHEGDPQDCVRGCVRPPGHYGCCIKERTTP